ncbi:MAG TPA: HAD-IIB family hydrolase [Ignavibacteriaceae bacterium]|nr:HAD-IIB family hydrolase [Ignavibacteriaceae bacterium]
MNYLLLACDYDGTLAKDGIVSERTYNSLKLLHDSGIKLLLVTGREIEDLKKVFNHFEIFEKIIAENGALIFDPHSKEVKLIGQPPPEVFIEASKRKGITRFSVGEVIFATWKPFENIVFEIIKDLGLELQVIFNKDAVMVLPPGINKAAGLKEALKIIDYSRHNVIGIGDAENDYSFLEFCGISAAVQNALPILKESVDYVAESDHGDGVSELIELLLDKKFANFKKRIKKCIIHFGRDENKKEINLSLSENSLLIVGSSGGGKTALATAIMEQLIQKQYQFCLIDPEGDYTEFKDAVPVGLSSAPTIESIQKVLQSPEQNCIVNLTSILPDDRPAFFQNLFPALIKLRSIYGRPHFVILDETHQLLPESSFPVNLKPEELNEFLFITVKPEQIAERILSSASIVLSIGEKAEKYIKNFFKAAGIKNPEIPDGKYQSLLWQKDKNRIFKITENISPKIKLKRHIKKYSEGDLGDKKSFVFSGPNGKLNLKAQNVMNFIRIAEGIDNETWTFHLKKNAYSEWFSKIVKDENLADEIKRIEDHKNLSPQKSRKMIINKIKDIYTAAV